MEEEGENVRSEGRERDAFIQALATNLHAFLQEHQHPLIEHGLRAMSTTAFLKHLDQSACQALEEQVRNSVSVHSRICRFLLRNE